MHYQTFPDQRGGSKSADKLAALRLPDLSGKRFLDLGCNEGYFCGYAQFAGAAEVIGIDRSAEAIHKAQRRFPDCQFVQQNWETLPDKKFDVVLLASALHYASNQEDFIHRLMQILQPDGVLVLEIGMAPGSQDAWVSVSRSIDQRLFPTRKKLMTVLKPYAWKIIGYSVKQAGDPLQRYVVHVQPKKPFIYLLLSKPGTGKTTIARSLFSHQSKIQLISGDHTYRMVKLGKLTAPTELHAVIAQCARKVDSNDDTDRVFDCAEVIRQVIAKGLLPVLVDFWASRLKHKDAAVDSFVPEEYHEMVCQLFEKKGYIPVLLSWRIHTSMSSASDSHNQVAQYEKYLATQPPNINTHRYVHIQRVRRGKTGVRWHLDYPVHGEPYVGDQPLRIGGWAVPRTTLPQTPLQLFIRQGSKVTKQVFNRRRRDVLLACFKTTEHMPAGFADCPVGFKVDLQPEWLQQGVTVGVIVDEVDIPLAKISLRRNSYPRSAAYALINWWRRILLRYQS